VRKFPNCAYYMAAAAAAAWAATAAAAAVLRVLAVYIPTECLAGATVEVPQELA
jgi:hypothetical protein